MKLSNCELDIAVDLLTDKPLILVIENQVLLRRTIESLLYEMEGKSEDFILSEKNKDIALGKVSEVITDVFSVETNQKAIINKILGELESIAQGDCYYEETLALRHHIQDFIVGLIQASDYNIQCNYDFSMVKFLSLMGISVDEDGDLVARIENYIKLSNRLLGKRVFFLHGISAVVSREQLMSFLQDIAYENLYVVILEGNVGYFGGDDRIILIDSDMCMVQYPENC